jgi:hypothetical protein
MRVGIAAMSIADKFDRTSEAGFVRAFDTRAARRQFQVSLALVLVLGLAAIVLGLLFQLDRLWAASSALKADSPPAAEISLDLRN